MLSVATGFKLELQVIPLHRDDPRPTMWPKFSLPSTIGSLLSLYALHTLSQADTSTLTLGTSFAYFWEFRGDEQESSSHEGIAIGDFGTSIIPKTLGKEISMGQSLNRG